MVCGILCNLTCFWFVEYVLVCSMVDAVLCNMQDELRKRQTRDEMMFGSHPAAAVSRKRHAATPSMSPRNAIRATKQASVDCRRL